MANLSPQRENATFVFHDARGHRWPRVKRLAFAIGVLLFVLVVLFVRSLYVQPELRLPGSVLSLRSQLQGIKRGSLSGVASISKLESVGPHHSSGPLQRMKRTGQDSPAGKIMLGFYVNRDKASWVSLQRHADQLTHVCPQWIFIKNENCELELRNQSEVEELAAAHDLKLVPLLTNFYEGWRDDLMETLIVGPKDTQDAFIHSAISMVKTHHYAGITVDFEEVAPEYSVAFNDFLVRFATGCHEEKIQFLLCVPVGLDSEVFDLDRLSEHVDYFVGMLYDENSPHDKPGPIASQPWFERWLKRLLEYGNPHQWIIGIGAFGCDWPVGGAVGKTIPFADAMATAAGASLPHLQYSKKDLNPTYSYEENWMPHTVWFLDALTACNQARTALNADTAGLAVYRLGMEDPSLWNALVLAKEDSINQQQLESLGELDPQDHVIHVGEGEVVRARENLQNGLREVQKTKDEKLSAIYTDFPSYLQLEHYGQVNPRWVALTFDDGPSGKWTPLILDILKKENVTATFFVLGVNVEKNPELAIRMMREGHEIGNHSYTHPNLATIPEVQVDLELNATQRLLESVIGRSTLLFRPPYLADSRPQTRAEALPILRAQKIGYVTICENIDPEDWSRPGADAIVARVKQQRDDGSVILLHDAGGDRSQTVEALPRIIHMLREQSHGEVRFITASQLIGLTRDDVMPPAPTKERMAIAATSVGLGTLYFSWETACALMIVASILVISRTLFITIVALMQHRRRKSEPPSGTFVDPPAVSILIAAYNEEKVIAGTIRSVINNTYEGVIEVIVVNDGSVDRTREVVETEFGNEPRVRLFNQPNSGKSAALAQAFQRARHDMLVSLDADTQLAAGAIRELVWPLMADERVGAVSGNARVGNRGAWLTEFQSLEYISSFNLDRRAYDYMNCITVVPGAIGAYRRSAIDRAGGFTADTLAEDTDLTLHIRKDGWRIAFAQGAVGFTESPETLRALVTQRFRWAFGTLQCLWKHRDALFNPRHGALGWVALPSMWFFQIGLVATAPLVDLLMLVSLFFGNQSVVLLYFTAFILSEIILAIVALRLEKENAWRALWVVPQRFVYRPMLAFVVWTAILRALRGALVGWGKLERTASVNLPQSG